MKLTYRGVSYNYEPAAVETRETAIAGKYRGAALKFRSSEARVPVLPSALDLIYRGVRYNVNPTQAAKPQPAAVPVATFNTPVQLTYRGVHYTTGASQTPPVNVTPVPSEAIADLARDLLIQLRRRNGQREQSVLARFEGAIGASTSDWSTYRHHDAAMS